jgi:RimJ/RimL family protein N-acetyltransferase
MTWRLTGSLDEFLAAAGDHLRSDPVRNTVPLTVLGALRQRGLSAFGEKPPVFGWHETHDADDTGRTDGAVATGSAGSPAGTVDGAFFQTPPFPVFLATFPSGSVGALLEALRAGPGLPAAINVPVEAEADFATAWTAATGATAAASLRSRLHRLAGLVPPEPAPAGAVRTAGRDDRDLLVRWHDDFFREAETAAPENSARTVDERLGHGGLRLWEVDGEPVAMAGSTRTVNGVVRVAGVYTPPARRRKGYGGGVTAAASQAALDSGAAAVVLYTDLANPTSNALYARLGYEPVADRVVLDLGESAGRGDVTAHGTTSS